MITDEIRKLLKKRLATDSEWFFALEQCWNEETEILSGNIDETISFIENECTGEEFILLSEVFEDVAERTHSRRLIAALRKTAEKYPEETKEYNVLSFINSSERLVDYYYFTHPEEE